MSYCCSEQPAGARAGAGAGAGAVIEGACMYVWVWAAPEQGRGHGLMMSADHSRSRPLLLLPRTWRKVGPAGGSCALQMTSTTQQTEGERERDNFQQYKAVAQPDLESSVPVVCLASQAVELQKCVGISCSPMTYAIALCEQASLPHHLPTTLC